MMKNPNYDILGEEHAVFITEDLRCPHPEDQIYIRVIGAMINCETTEAYCGICGKAVAPPKTDCV